MIPFELVSHELIFMSMSFFMALGALLVYSVF
jgi:hypothetical protein